MYESWGCGMVTSLTIFSLLLLLRASRAHSVVRPASAWSPAQTRTTSTSTRRWQAQQALLWQQNSETPTLLSLVNHISMTWYHILVAEVSSTLLFDKKVSNTDNYFSRKMWEDKLLNCNIPYYFVALLFFDFLYIIL